MAQLESVDLGENWRDVVLFEYDGVTFKRNTKVRDYLNNLLSAELQAVYTEEKSEHDLKHGLDWSGEFIIFVNSKGEIGYMSNSEWASFDKI